MLYRFCFAVFFIFVSMIASPTFANDWSINHIPDANQPDKIAYCVLERTEDNGDTVYIARDKAGDGRFLIGFDSAVLGVGEFYDVRLDMSSNQAERMAEYNSGAIKAKAIRDNLLLVPLPSTFFNVPNFTDYRYASLAGLSQNISFDLGNNWTRWLKALDTCRETLLDDIAFVSAVPAISHDIETTEKAAQIDNNPHGFLAQQLQKAAISYSHIDEIGGANKVVDAIWYGEDRYQNIKGAYKQISLQTRLEEPTQLSPMVEDYLIPIKRLCEGVFVSEVSHVERLGDDYFVRADFACSPDSSAHQGGDTVSSLLFLSAQNHLHIFMQEAPAVNAANVLKARDDILFSFSK